jgi:hypothetical protein
VNGICYWAVSDTALPRLCFVQVYAPTAVPRSLCIFGCNTPACSISPQGWRVLRTTAPNSEPPESKQAEAVAAQTAAEPEPELSWGAADGDDWSAPAAAAADGWGAGDSSSDWGSSVTAASDSTATLDDALAQLLINREAATTAAAAAAAEQKAQPPAQLCSKVVPMMSCHRTLSLHLIWCFILSPGAATAVAVAAVRARMPAWQLRSALTWLRRKTQH